MQELNELANKEGGKEGKCGCCSQPKRANSLRKRQEDPVTNFSQKRAESRKEWSRAVFVFATSVSRASSLCLFSLCCSLLRSYPLCLSFLPVVSFGGLFALLLRWSIWCLHAGRH